jgi:hypothetical protein
MVFTYKRRAHPFLPTRAFTEEALLACPGMYSQHAAPKLDLCPNVFETACN